MVRAGIFAGVDEVVGGDEPDAAVLLAHDGETVAGDVVEHQHLAEDALALEVLENRAHAALVDALNARRPGDDQADDIAAVVEVIDQILRQEALLPHAEAHEHALLLLIRDAGKKRRVNSLHTYSFFSERVRAATSWSRRRPMMT